MLCIFFLKNHINTRYPLSKGLLVNYISFSLDLYSESLKIYIWKLIVRHQQYWVEWYYYYMYVDLLDFWYIKPYFKKNYLVLISPEATEP